MSHPGPLGAVVIILPLAVESNKFSSVCAKKQKTKNEQKEQKNTFHLGSSLQLSKTTS